MASSSLWPALWKAGVPLKSKCSGGRYARLTKHNLSKKQVSLDLTCVFCEDGCESTIHLLMTAFLLKVFGVASLPLIGIKSIVVSWPRSGFTTTVISPPQLTLPPF
ncbi:hypothetical protein Pyn_35865 [Prunus yedoensis var. nudiflora]|uniref:Uncharacterized protein n=1 Tax=Prunus yedoensis var. nudiflora TaxID=2094558 RepID=A0A314XZA0_PRUYE|nr:hypothetical protein Pyn_35865 [Prunus yedoensis var. nudiflora]